MMSLNKFVKTSTKTLHSLRFLHKAKQCYFFPKVNFSLECVTNNKCVCGYQKQSPIKKLKCDQKSLYSIFVSEDIFSSEYEMEEADIGNLSNVYKIDKNHLYPSSKDPLISEIKNCMSVQDVFDIINSNIDSLNHHHACQLLLELHCIQKNYCLEYVEHLEKNDFDISPKQMLDNFISKLMTQKEFEVLTNIILQNFPFFSLKELTFCFYYFRNINFDFSNELISKLNRIIEDKIETAKNEWSLFDMMKYTQAIKTNESLRFSYLVRPTVPLVLDFLDKCETENDFKFVTICMHNIHTLITKQTLKLHKIKCMSLIKSGLITNNHVDTLLRAINLYNLAHWSRHNTDDISFLCKLLQPSIDKMDALDLTYLHKVFQIHSTPAEINKDINKRVLVLLEEMKHDERIKTYLKLPDLLHCQVSTSSRNNNKILEIITKDLLKEQFSKIFPSIYKTLRYLKTPDNKLCDTFWLTSLNSVLKCANNDDEILQLCYKYMHFNNHFGGTYRNVEFEEKMLNKLLEMKGSISYIIPYKLCRLSSFIFAYGLHKLEITELNNHLNHLTTIMPQLNPQDIIMLSKGIQINFMFKKNNFVNFNVRNQALSKFTHILEDYSQELLSKNNLSIYDLNIIFRSNINIRSTNYKSEIRNKILSLYDDSKEDLSPRSVRDAAYNIYLAGSYIPNFTDRVIDYVASEKHDITANVVSKILVMCYMFSHSIKNEKFLKYSLKVIDRDFDILHGLPLLDASISLCFYNYISEKLIKRIFSLEFMDRIDEEIEFCYSKKIYPNRLRKRLMILNRAVCLDLPQYQVPWFHKKYIEENMALHSGTPSRNIFHDEVLSILKNIIGDSNSLQYPAYTPYGYKIDFLLHLDNNESLVTNKYSRDGSLSRKIAIVLLHKNSFVKSLKRITPENKTEPFIIQDIIRGSTLMRTRHLELLGYKVINISYMLWYSMHMTEPQAKYNLLKEKIWSK